MTLSQQAAVILEAVDQDLIRANEVIRWADRAIVTSEQPPRWLVELAILNPSDITGIISLTRANATDKLPVHWRIQILVLACETGLLSLGSSLPKLFHVLIGDARNTKESPLDERLRNALVDWDIQDCPDQVDPPLYLRFEALFREYLADAEEISGVLNWKRGHVIS